jgi:Asp-tRNA(Asn)/Glu-tRNA(Gln) amidotransferase A subunit family amidase
VAVDAGMALIGMGTDTGGSVRIPAALQRPGGLQALRLVGWTQLGVFPLSATLDVIGPMAKTVQDCAWTYHALLGCRSRRPATCRHPAALRVVVPEPTWCWTRHKPEVLARFESVLARLRGGWGAGGTPAHPAFDALQALTAQHGTIPAAEAYVLHRRHRRWAGSPARLDSRVLARIQRGATMMASDMVVLQQARVRLMARNAGIGGWRMAAVPHRGACCRPGCTVGRRPWRLFNQTNVRTLPRRRAAQCAGLVRRKPADAW